VDISELFSELQLTSNDDPAASADLEQRLAHLQQSLRALPPKVSTTLILHRFAGFSIEEIGQQLGVSRRTAKNYLARALTHCRAAEAGAADKDAR
jgi:RNA polymerase sigma factor (sigma-70 family)